MTPTESKPDASAAADHSPTALAGTPGMAAGRPMPILMSVLLLQDVDSGPGSRARLPSVLNEGDIYREWAPPPAWRHAVACCWEQRVTADRIQRVVPDGRADVL